MLFQRDNGGVEWIVVGLGNPGEKYLKTRHNAGFLCIEKMEDEYGFKAKKLKFHALIGDGYIDSHKVIVMKPQTMMNNSGQAIKECADFYKIPVENITVVYDDTSFEPGTFKIKKKGSAGGHNGLKNIILHLRDILLMEPVLVLLWHWTDVQKFTLG